MPKYQFGTAGWVGFVVAGSTVNLTANWTEISWKEEADEVEVSSGNALHKEFLAGMRSWSASYKGFMDDSNAPNTGGTADWFRLTVGTTGLFVFGDFGTASGRPRYGGSCIITARERAEMTNGAQNAAEMRLEMRGTGAPWFNAGSVW